MDYDVSRWADGNPAFQVRFRMSYNNAKVFCGWNIDNLTITNSRFDKAGEHTLWSDADNLQVTNNDFKRCGNAGGPCLVTCSGSLEPPTRITITDNRVTDTVGEFFGLESGASCPGLTSEIDVSHNILSAPTYSMRKSWIRFIQSTGGGSVTRFKANDNIMELTGKMCGASPILVIADIGATPYPTKLEVNGNIVNTSEDTAARISIRMRWAGTARPRILGRG